MMCEQPDLVLSLWHFLLMVLTLLPCMALFGYLIDALTVDEPVTDFLVLVLSMAFCVGLWAVLLHAVSDYACAIAPPY